MSEDKERLLHSNGVFPKHVRDAMDSINKELEDFRHTNNMLARLMNEENQGKVDMVVVGIPESFTEVHKAIEKHNDEKEQAHKDAEKYKTCNALKLLVIDVLRKKDWTINNVKFSDKGNLESINIKFSNQFALGGTNNPWDPR